jgi:uncharacterized membrane protein YeaQ/YmgE (transglycosylase-associated protein family)
MMVTTALVRRALRSSARPFRERSGLRSAGGILGIEGAFVATYLGHAIGWYRADEGAGLIGVVVGAVIVLVICGLIGGKRRLSRPT